MKYRCDIRATALATVTVEAANAEEAREKAFFSDYTWDYDDYEISIEEEPDLPAGG